MISLDEPTRVINLNYECEGLHFDAAIDCDWQMHAYELGIWGEESLPKDKQVPIELYCYDHTDWDIHMMYQAHKNPQGGKGIRFTLVSFEEILQETREWIKEMKEREKEEQDDGE